MPGADWEAALNLEREAERLTWEAWRRRDRDRLFKLGDLNWRPKKSYRAWDEAWAWKAVGVVPPIDTPFDVRFGQAVKVGIWLPVGPKSYLDGVDIRLRSLTSSASTTHRDPTSVGFVYVLPDDPFQAKARLESEDDVVPLGVECSMCQYRFREDEFACKHCWRCAGCCDGIYGVKPCSESVPWDERQAA